MRKRLLLFLLLFIAVNLYCQHNLSGSRKSSYYTYIYRVSPSETIDLFKSDMDRADEKYLHTLVDSFLTKDNEPKFLKEGDYLFVRAEDNQLRYDLKIIGDVQCKLINNNHDLVVALHTKQGELISDAKVFINKRKIDFDSETKTYRVNRRSKTGLIKVEYKDVQYLFPLTKKQQGYYPHQSFFARLSNSFPLRYITGLFKKNIHYTADYFQGTAYEKAFRGFMVFSKPKYKPGDTVKLKAYVMNKQGKPVNRPLLLRLAEERSDKDTILTVLQPFRPGGYEYQFVITDSLDLTLDEQQLVTLEELKSRKYDLKKYEGDLEDEEYMAKREVLMRGRFVYEEYELGKIHFTVRADKEVHNRNNPVAIYLKAMDENDLAVTDGRVQILVTPYAYRSTMFHAASVFLPDTLWNHSQALEPLGETKIIIPDSIFPAASFSYEIQCIFLNGDNEYKTETLEQSFRDNKRGIYFTANKDSLQIEQKNGELSEKANGMLYAFNQSDDTLQHTPIELPATISINPFVKYYTIKTANSTNEFQLQHARGMVSSVAARTADSINMQVINPNHLFFWYSIFAGNKIINRGYTDRLTYIEKTHTAKNYFIALQYIYGNEVFNENYTVPYQDKLLNIEVTQPEFVYPGQQVSIGVSVTNKAGKPVHNADITAYSFTNKFENERAPFVPYLGKIYPRRKSYRNFFAEKPEEKNGTSLLNWERWSREIGLDSIEYFKFLHPATMYTNTETAADSITQLAPFVVMNGNLQPVHQIYIDEVPYYFSQAQQLQRYSFKVTPGKHALRLRTNNLLIKLDSVWVWKGVKTFISINADTSVNHGISAVKMPDSLNTYEKMLWSKYMILVENSFDEAPAAITQNNLLYLLNPPYKNANYTSHILTGPFPDRYSILTVKNQFSQPFETEGNYLFNVSKGLIKQKQLPFGKYAFNSFLSAGKPVYNFHDLVLTQKEVDNLWQDYLDHRSASEDLFRNENLNKLNNGRLQIAVGKDFQGKPVFVKNIFLFRYDDADFVRVYKGSSLDLGYVQPGMYRILLLLKDDEYFIKDSIEIRKDGVNFYQTGAIDPVKKDSVSIRIAAIINGREKNWRSTYQGSDLDIIKESFNEKYLDASSFSKYIFGSVHDIKDGSPVSGVTITVKGTRFATVTDQQGLFSLKVPEKGTLVIAALGYATIEKRITEESNYDFKLHQQSFALNEVVVVGYGISKKQELTGSVSIVSADNFLAGKVPGLQITLRGTSSLEDNGPLIIVDGLPFPGKLSDLDKDLIASINILKPAEATGLYGTRAGNGVIIINTKKGNADKAISEREATALPGNVLRRNFSDAAYWQPRLQTDINGKTSFTITFPDDITKWRTFVIAMGDKKQTGFAEGAIKSFKAISANISLPAFVVEGDSINAIGKILNYTLDSIRVKRSFSINNTVIKDAMVGVRNSIIDTLAIVVAGQDSLKIKYTVEKMDGYFDGEERTILVFKQGVQETKGYFAALDSDTSFSLSFDSLAGKVKLHAESSVLPVLLDEIESIQRYEYLCNEQLASKLKALLIKKKIYGYLKKDFTEGKNIYALITKLNQGRSQAGLWGWWSNNDPSLWISLHATEALLLAEKDGYAISMDKEIIKDYLIYNFEKYDVASKLSCVTLLKALDAKVDFKKYTDTLEKKMPLMNLYQRLQFLQIKQQLNMLVALDTIVAKVKTTMFGNMYWGDDNNRFFDNAVQNTLLMYRLMKTAGGYEKQLRKISNYFLEKRKNGQWRNTYESSLILETILSGILKNDAMPGKPIFTVNDMQPVQSFPYTAEINSMEKLTIKKQGNWPVYFTAYQQYWNTAPIKRSDDFIVNSFFEKNDHKVTVLKAGEPVIMKVNVNVRGDADYIMIEIPIPAGCSYKDKMQSYSNNEVHREYFKNKVSIFCSSLRKGQYTFTISLLPRYTGIYQLNPAKAEMMYFPVFYGREGMKKINIE